MSIEIIKAKNGYVINFEDDQWVAGDVDEVKNIVEELLEEFDSEED